MCLLKKAQRALAPAPPPFFEASCTPRELGPATVLPPQKAVALAMSNVEAACKSGQNVMPSLIEAVKAYATLGELSDLFRRVWGAYREAASF